MPAPSSPSSLPAPDAAALAHSERLVRRIRDEIEGAGGWIPFVRYMDLALYAPGLGYYAGGAAKFGGAGDFVTAPELTPLFGRTLARVVAQVLARSGGDLLELGAGSGRLAVDMLLELERLACLPERYLILEVSPDLRARQRQLLAEQASHLLPRVAWLDALPDRLRGVILGNEVLDALPAHLLHGSAEGVLERGVVWTQAGFAWADRPVASPDLAEAVARLPLATLALDGHSGASRNPETSAEGTAAYAGVTGSFSYLCEINLAAPALIASLADRLECGLLLFLDYGYPRAEYYHPQRHMGTLRAHYRQHALDDPFFLPGLADLTAHVDFSAVARAGQEAGLDLLGYTSQANFLMDAGILELMLEMEPMTPPYLRAATAVQRLLQPSEMGELFKAIALGRGVAGELPGFRRGDRRAAL
ncbi:MAG: hypothetical protein FD187_3012 [bacterium]|nr:MAG: hypothetical protein FD142_1440 [bacterium]KAF0147149.1 MAG: hypothetical protein FD187_3012 [bacterium]KAF0165714.1 MAG: hypothetical protein FD158_2811 [bacterium]